MKKVHVLRESQGFALIMTLWVMVFLIIMVTSFALASRWAMTSTLNFKQETEAYYLALSGYDTALQYLMNDSDQHVDLVDGNGFFIVDREHLPLPETIELYNGEIKIRISDEQARLNMNMISQQRLRRLLDYAGIEEERQNEIVDSLTDWIDPDDLHRLNGAEDDYYGEFGYESKDGPLDVPEEMLLIKGIDDDVYYGSDTYKGIGHLITVFGNNAMNVNTVNEEMMGILGLGAVEIDYIMSYRDQETGGLTQVPPSLSPYGLNTTASSYLRIEIESVVGESGISYSITAVVKRVPALKGYRVETVSWREHVAYS